MKAHNFAHLFAQKMMPSPFDPHGRAFADLAMNYPKRSKAFTLQLLTVDFEPDHSSGHQATGNFSARFGKPVWIVDCITIESPGFLTGWRGIRSRDPNCYQPAT